MIKVEEAFDSSGLLMEFIETLVNDTDIPEKLRRQIWTLASSCTWGSNADTHAVIDIAASFEDSDGPENLTQRWEVIVARYWPQLADCPLKREIDGR